MKAVYTSLASQAEGARKIHVHVTELDPSGGGWTRQHSHAAEEAIYILQGEAEFTFGGDTYRVGPGQLVFFPSGVMHAEAKFFTDKMKYLVIRGVEASDEPCCCGTAFPRKEP